MPLTLVSSTTSAFARLNRIALIEKGISFELQTTTPWDSSSSTPDYNPLEKLPIIIFEDGFVIYDSAHIQDYIVQKFPHIGPRLLSEDLDRALEAKQIQTLAEGHMDAIALNELEKSREHPSAEWQARQNRKIDGGLAAYSRYVKAVDERGENWLIENTFSIADIAVGCALGWIDFWGARPGWKVQYPELAVYWERLSDRQSFKATQHTRS